MKEHTDMESAAMSPANAAAAAGKMKAITSRNTSSSIPGLVRLSRPDSASSLSHEDMHASSGAIATSADAGPMATTATSTAAVPPPNDKGTPTTSQTTADSAPVRAGAACRHAAGPHSNLTVDTGADLDRTSANSTCSSTGQLEPAESRSSRTTAGSQVRSSRGSYRRLGSNSISPPQPPPSPFAPYASVPFSASIAAVLEDKSYHSQQNPRAPAVEPSMVKEVRKVGISVKQHNPPMVEGGVGSKAARASLANKAAGTAKGVYAAAGSQDSFTQSKSNGSSNWWHSLMACMRCGRS
mmetsp:Transcript_25306/g.54988  ORF Transcript_25306/g.54988 Transcript_25306/m.54988 type:complete len:297 (-) Transcript_25306:1150-2040(-)